MQDIIEFLHCEAYDIVEKLSHIGRVRSPFQTLDVPGQIRPFSLFLLDVRSCFPGGICMVRILHYQEHILTATIESTVDDLLYCRS